MDIFMSRTCYVSPFPRKRANEEFLKSFNITQVNISDKTKPKIAKIHVPPEKTKSYMAKNPFYFELQERRLNLNKAKPKKIVTSLKPTASKSHLIIEKNKIISLLGNDLNKVKSQNLHQENIKNPIHHTSNIAIEQKNIIHTRSNDKQPAKNSRKMSNTRNDKNIKTGVVPE
jgi:hypothetical protein